MEPAATAVQDRRHADTGYGSPLVDEKDRRLIALLRVNPREPTASLARKAGLSRSTVYDRLQRLKDTGVVLGYSLRVSPQVPKALISAYMFVTILGPMNERILRGLDRILRVERTETVSGPMDLIVTVGANNTNELDQLRSQIEAIHGVRSVATVVVLAEKLARS